MGTNPLVSVIVPVRDGAALVGACLEALCAQTWPRDRLELIVVDDGSVDETRGRVRQFPVDLLPQRGVGSPYAARNAGIARARGEILAFTDADCVPEKDWVARGVATLEDVAADLAAGHVRFRCSDPPRAAELADAIRNLDQERSIAERGVAKTGNLFVRRLVIDALGGFDPKRRSGEDVAFTARASGAGYTLVYAPDAVVEKHARGGLAAWRKQWRVGRGQYALWRNQAMPGREIARRTLLCLRPERPHSLREALRRRGPVGSERRVLRVCLAAWLLGLAQGLGRLRAWLGNER